MPSSIQGSWNERTTNPPRGHGSLEGVSFAKAFSAPSQAESRGPLCAQSPVSLSLEQQLIHALRPPIDSPETLTPNHYGTMLEKAQDDLREMLVRLRPEDRQTLDKAARALQERKDLWDLLNTYRHVLHQA